MRIDRKSFYVNGVVPVESTLPDLKKWGNEPLSVNIKKKKKKIPNKWYLFQRQILTISSAGAEEKICVACYKSNRTECARGRAKEVVRDLTGWGMGRRGPWRALRDTKDFGFCSKWNGEVLEDFEKRYDLAHFLKLPLWLLAETRLYFYK